MITIDRQYSSSAARIADESRVTVSQIAQDSDTGNIYVRITGGWLQISTAGAAHVTDGNIGIARNRFINAVHNTLPTAAGSGTATYAAPGVVGIVVDSVYLVAGPVPLATTNWRVRYAVDSVSDAAAAILLPVAEPGHSATADAGQVGSFNVTPVTVADTEAAGDLRIILLTLPRPVYIDVSDPIRRLDFVHNLGAGVTIQLGIRSVEKLS